MKLLTKGTFLPSWTPVYMSLVICTTSQVMWCLSVVSGEPEALTSRNHVPRLANCLKSDWCSFVLHVPWINMENSLPISVHLLYKQQKDKPSRLVWKTIIHHWLIGCTCRHFLHKQLTSTGSVQLVLYNYIRAPLIKNHISNVEIYFVL